MGAFKVVAPSDVCIFQEGGPLDGRGISEVRQPSGGVSFIGVFNSQHCLERAAELRLAREDAQLQADETFAIMRRLDPIVRAGPTTIVALNEDVKEVLGDPARFTTHDYAAKLEAITGPFMAGLDDPPRHDHDRTARDRAVTRDDFPRLASATYATARRALAEARHTGEIDIVAQLADPIFDRTVADLFGTPGPNTPTQLRWARSVFQEIFYNVGNLPSVRERALADAALWRVHLDALIDARRARLEAGEYVPDDVLMRLLRSEGEAPEPSLRGGAIRHNLLLGGRGRDPETYRREARNGTETGVCRMARAGRDGFDTPLAARANRPPPGRRP